MPGDGTMRLVIHDELVHRLVTLSRDRMELRYRIACHMAVYKTWGAGEGIDDDVDGFPVTCVQCLGTPWP